MGYLQATYSLGELANQKNKNSPLADMMNEIQLPHSLDEPEDRKAHVIRVWLDVADPGAEILDVRGVKNVDRIEYAAIGEEIRIRERCLYHKPAGANVSWRFSPLFKLGRGVKEPVKELLGDGWKSDNKSRLYKLNRNVLMDYETIGRFTEGSVERIMTGLTALIDKIAGYWSDNKRSYLLLFGVKHQGEFLYPGEIAVFIAYFRSKLGKNIEKKTDSKKHESYNCSLCGIRSHQSFTLDRILPFSTFDKENFLPGIKAGVDVLEKVFPVCKSCYGLLSAGIEEMGNRFADFSTIPGIILYVIPEIVSDNQNHFRTAAGFTQDFIEKGIKHESGLFQYLAGQCEGLIYHFLFAEKNQAQIIVHSLVEDVPPSRLKKLQELWMKTCTVFEGDDRTDRDERCSLDTAIRQTVAILFSLAGKSKQDKMVMREKSLAVLSALLNGDQIRINEIKSLMVSRFAGLFADPDWIGPRGKGGVPGRLRLKGMAETVDFIIRANGR